MNRLLIAQRFTLPDRRLSVCQATDTSYPSYSSEALQPCCLHKHSPLLSFSVPRKNA